jgi:polyhydroxyalkanoate synthesis regulator phasin
MWEGMNLRVHSLSIYCQNAIQKTSGFSCKIELEERKNRIKDLEDKIKKLENELNGER